jgi:hypothetical protein
MAGLSWRIAADLGVAAAAFLSQVGQQRTHALDVDRVEDAALVAPGGGETGALKLGEVRREGRGRHLQPLGDLPGRQADRALTDQEAKDLQPGGVRQRGERLQGVWCLHTVTAPFRCFMKD